MISEKRVAASKDWIKGATGDWEIIIGLEVHAQVHVKVQALFRRFRRIRRRAQ